MQPPTSPDVNPSRTSTPTTEKSTSSSFEPKGKSSAGLGQKAAETIDQGREGAAGGLDSASSALHERADRLPGGEKVAGAAHATADALSSTADYIRENDLQSMVQDV